MSADETGHPLPESDEARHNEIPERLEREKGEGDEGKVAIQPTQPAANPDGEPYRYGDRQQDEGSECKRDQLDHQRRGQDSIESDR